MPRRGGSRWAATAQQQAKSFVYASPVLDRDIGAITTVKGTAEELAKHTPPTYDVAFHVAGLKGDGTVAIEITRHGPNERLVSSAKLERGRQSQSLL